MRSLNREKLVVLMALASAGATGLAAWGQTSEQSSGQAGAYQGVSQPPSDPIVTTGEPQAPVLTKPSAGVVAQPASQPTPAYAQPGQSYAQPVPRQASSYGADNSINAEGLNARPSVIDPDGDMVHPRTPRDGELVEGATIRVRLMDRLSSTQSEKGQHFRGQVASDVLQNGRVMIPAGSGIEGRVTNVSSGHFGGHGSFRLKPDVVVLPDGTRYELHAYTTGAPGSKARVGSEGTINPGSRAKKNGIEYGAVVGTGAITGAVLGGPVGALAGSLVGAGMVTTHIMVDHAQANLEPGAVLLFTLTEPMNLIPPGQPGS